MGRERFRPVVRFVPSLGYGTHASSLPICAGPDAGRAALRAVLDASRAFRCSGMREVFGLELTLELDAALGEDAALVGVFGFAHLGDGVGQFNEDGVGVAAGEDDVDHLRAAAEGVGDGFGGEQVVGDGVVDLVEDDEVPVAGEDGGGGFVPGGLDEAEVFGVGLGSADFDEAAAELLDDDGWVLGCAEGGAESGDGVEFAVVP